MLITNIGLGRYQNTTKISVNIRWCLIWGSKLNGYVVRRAEVFFYIMVAISTLNDTHMRKQIWIWSFLIAFYGGDYSVFLWWVFSVGYICSTDFVLVHFKWIFYLYYKYSPT